MVKAERKPAGREASSAQGRKVESKTGAEIRGIVRVAGRDLAGEMPLPRALARVKGVGERLAPVFSVIVSRELKVPTDTYVGELTEEQIDRVEAILSNPQKHGLPLWMLNRRRDVDTGLDRHLIGTDLTFTVRQDVDREKNTNSWIGYRHNYGQKVRGQHTRTTGRRGMTVGVIRKSIMAKQGPAAAGGAAGASAKKEEKK
jgi:small subunit ribosomal protein S13